MSDAGRSDIAVLGAGSFGTALAILLARNGNRVRLWGRDSQQMQKLASERENARYLPGIRLPQFIEPSADIEATLKGCRDILVVTPSHAFDQTLSLIKEFGAASPRVAWACKGLEPGTGAFLHTRIESLLGRDIAKAVLSGPTFATELAKGMPTAITLAADNEQFANDLSARLVNDTFRVYFSKDLKGVQLGGAVKNVVAIGAGIADGLGFGANARTALITRGLAEMMRLGKALGAQAETFTGMAGLGDLVLTCTDDQSRNRRFGLALGRGAGVNEAAEQIGQVVEGVRNAKELHTLALAQQVELPVCEAIYKILHLGQDPKQAAKELLTRELKQEGV